MNRFDRWMSIVAIVLFLAVMGAWWWGLHEYRFLVSEYRVLVTEVTNMKTSMKMMQNHVESSERMLSVLEDIQSEIKGRK